MTGIYVHLPFCPYICPYCDFAKWPHKRSAAQRYLRALFAEIESCDVQEGQSVFLGGGTPNTYEANDIAALLDRLSARFPGPRDRETTIEINPELAAAADFRRYAAAGVNRISIGVQSFVAAEIATLGRNHSPTQVREAVRFAREAGIASVSADLMFGVPGQDAQSWLQSLQAAIELDVDHISAYGLTIEEGTPYAAWAQREPRAFPGEDCEAELYDLAIVELEGAGYEHYEISNFARPGHRSKHNANYWANGEYVGLGVGAASYREGVRSVHTKDLDSYINAVLEGQTIPGQSEALQGAQRAGEAVMLALRTAQGVSLQIFKDRYDLDFLTFYSDVIARYAGEGLLEVDESSVRLTRRGRFVANDVCAAFVTFA